MDLLVRSDSGELTGSDSTVSVSSRVFGSVYNEALVHQVVVAFLASARAGTKAQKTRSQVRGGGKKPWRQKGTGHARAGTSRSPLWRGGGVTFAATPRSYVQKVNKQMYRGAMRCILSELVRQDRLVVLQEFEIEQPKTKLVLERLKTLGLNDVMIVVDHVSDSLYLSVRNLPYVGLADAWHLDPVSLIRSHKTVVTLPVIKKLEEWLA